MKSLIKRFIQRQRKWSIGIYSGASPFDWSAPKGISNPVLQAKDVTDVPAEFVADPFMVYEGDRWYMFFEVFNACDRQGEIGLATSTNGLDWRYQQIVLSEPFHLSYPYVFKWNESYYMIPESCEQQAVRLYRAVHFPTQWTFVQNLLQDGEYVDSSVFYFNHHWWLFTTSKTSDALRLYFADDLLGTWTEHPCSPVVSGNLSIARPGGRVLVDGETVVRYTQDVGHVYGKQVRAFTITTLTTTDYQEQAVNNDPVLRPSRRGWNATGMHNIDPHPIAPGEWIACVDGYRFAIAINHARAAKLPFLPKVVASDANLPALTGKVLGGKRWF
jgi:hypothetical protein